MSLEKRGTNITKNEDNLYFSHLLADRFSANLLQNEKD